MFSSFLKLIFALGLLNIISNSSAQSKTYNVELNSYETLDLCQEELENQIVIAPYMGTILKRDSLVGFEISIKYDPTKVIINEEYTINTIAQFFKYVETYFDKEEGVVVVDCLSSFSNPIPVAGDLPLIALGGKYIGECDDSISFEIEYFEPTVDFVGTIDSLKSLTIDAKIEEKPNRKLEYEVLSNIIKTKKDSSIIVPISIDLGVMSSIEYLNTNISFQSDSLILDSITGNSSIPILNYNKIDNETYSVGIRILDDIHKNIQLHFTSIAYDSSDTKISIETKEFTECSCITNVENNNFSIQNIQTITEPIDFVDDLQGEFEVINNQIIPLKRATTFEVYDYSSRLIDKKICSINQVYSINQLEKGIYFIKITNSNFTKIIKIINN